MADIITTPVGVSYEPNNAQYPFWNPEGGQTDGRALINVTCTKNTVGTVTTYRWQFQRADLSIENIIAQEFSTVDGTTFTPSVSDNGILSWTNDGGKPNPPAVNVMGPAGRDGQQGPRGLQGEKGDEGFSPVVTLADYDGGTQVTIQDANGSQVFNVPDGAPGATGPAPEVTFSAIVTTDGSGLPGATVTKDTTGNNQAFTITFKNIQGETGDQGEPGFSPTVTIAEIEGGHSVTVTTASGSSSFNVMDGEDGTSPSVSTAKIEGGNAVTFTDASGSKTINVMDGGTGPAGADAPVPTPQVNVTGEGETGATVTVTEDSEGNPVWTFSFTGITGTGGGGGTVPTIAADATVDGGTGTPSVEVTRTGSDDNFTLHFAFHNLKGEGGTDGTNGNDGQDGFSPSASVTQTEDGATISVTDKTGTTTANIKNGEDGFSPSIMSTPITGGHEVTVTDKDGSESFNVMDGAPGVGEKGDPGDTPEITITATQGEENVPVTKTGSGAAQNFNFQFPGSSGGSGGWKFMPNWGISFTAPAGIKIKGFLVMAFAKFNIGNFSIANYVGAWTGERFDLYVNGVIGGGALFYSANLPTYHINDTVYLMWGEYYLPIEYSPSEEEALTIVLQDNPGNAMQINIQGVVYEDA